MTLYCGIDLHSNNHVSWDRRRGSAYRGETCFQFARPNLGMLAPYREEIAGIAVESTFNWYWLVDGLMEQGFALHLVNTAAVKQYEA